MICENNILNGIDKIYYGNGKTKEDLLLEVKNKDLNCLAFGLIDNIINLEKITNGQVKNKEELNKLIEIYKKQEEERKKEIIPNFENENEYSIMFNGIKTVEEESSPVSLFCRKRLIYEDKKNIFDLYSAFVETKRTGPKKDIFDITILLDPKYSKSEIVLYNSHCEGERSESLGIIGWIASYLHDNLKEITKSISLESSFENILQKRCPSFNYQKHL
jgi:hypothetical protein